MDQFVETNVTSNELFLIDVVPDYSWNDLLIGGVEQQGNFLTEDDSNIIDGGRIIGAEIEGSTISATDFNIDNTTGLKLGDIVILNANSTKKNLFIGEGAGIANTTAIDNTFVGYRSGYLNTEGTDNAFFGMSAGYSNILGQDNTFIGSWAGYYSIGNYNTFLGGAAGIANTYGDEGVFIGQEAGNNNTIGDGNIFIGYQAGYRQTTTSNLLIIDNRSRASTAVELTNSIIYGTMATITTNQRLRLNANVGILTSTFGASSNGVLAIANGTAPGAHVDNEIQIYSIDSSDSTATLALMLEQAVEAIGTFTADYKLKVLINGVAYWIQLDSV